MFKLTFTGMPNNFSSDGIYKGYDGIIKITIHSAKKKLASIYSPYNDKNTCGDLEIKFGGDSNNDQAARKANGAGNVVYAALRFLPLGETETDEITFSIQTTAGDYTAKMTSPVGGFQNGKYYTVTVKMNNAPQYANDAIEVFQHSDPRLDNYMWGYPSYTHITLNQAYALAKYLGTTTGNTVAVVYDNDMMQVNYALSTDASATAHQLMGDMLFDMYHYHVYLVP
jgi:hypothetical protein